MSSATITATLAYGGPRTRRAAGPDRRHLAASTTAIAVAANATRTALTRFSASNTPGYPPTYKWLSGHRMQRGPKSVVVARAMQNNATTLYVPVSTTRSRRVSVRPDGYVTMTLVSTAALDAATRLPTVKITASL